MPPLPRSSTIRYRLLMTCGGSNSTIPCFSLGIISASIVSQDYIGRNADIGSILLTQWAGYVGKEKLPNEDVGQFTMTILNRGWLMGFEPTTSSSTVKRSAI